MDSSEFAIDVACLAVRIAACDYQRNNSTLKVNDYIPLACDLLEQAQAEVDRRFALRQTQPPQE